jgi:large subunit ribosomal protein L4
MSGRNEKKVSVLEAGKPSTYEILHADVVLIQQSAVSVLESTFAAKEEVAA